MIRSIGTAKPHMLIAIGIHVSSVVPCFNHVNDCGGKGRTRNDCSYIYIAAVVCKLRKLLQLGLLDQRQQLCVIFG